MLSLLPYGGKPDLLSRSTGPKHIATMSSTNVSTPEPEKTAHYAADTPKDDTERAMVGGVFDADEEHEVFKRGAGVDFRTVGWPRATVIFLKVIFAVGVLTIPTAMYSLGAVGGALSVVAWGVLHTYAALIQGVRMPGEGTCAGSFSTRRLTSDDAGLPQQPSRMPWDSRYGKRGRRLGRTRDHWCPVHHHLCLAHGFWHSWRLDRL